MSFPIGLVLLLVCGCGPPGPRALLTGERLIREGKYEQAIESLQTATRLLPRNAQAYNHLGLALHGSRRLAQAAVAYQRALALDHKLAAAHYNLGCLYLEQGDASAAVDQLTSYTLLQPNSVDGWLKLGDAQLRARKPDAAEKSFKTTLILRPQHPEALNGLGIVQLFRRRAQDALNYFNQALNQNQNYGPALLNAAVVSHQYLNNRQGALEKYRRYLALEPRPAEWETVSTLANRLDLELNPPPIARVVQSVPPPVISPAPTAAPPAAKMILTSSPPVVQSRPVSNHPPPVTATVVPRTNPPAVSPSPPALSPSPPKVVAAQTNPATTNPFVIANLKPSTTETPKPPPLPVPSEKPTVLEKPVEVEVTHVAEDLVIKPPQEIAVVKPPAGAPPPRSPGSPALPENKTTSGANTSGMNNARSDIPSTSIPASPLSAQSDTKTEKKGLIARLNPFGGKTKSNTGEATTLPPAESPKPISVFPDATTNPVLATTTPSPAAPVSNTPRYTYLSPPKPSSGNRAEAERYFTEGIKAQQAGRLTQALTAYQKATQTDPAYFEAYYNRGLAAYKQSNWMESLADYEHALAIKPNSIDARYNFALSLQQANYPQDAADELLEVLNGNPAETRAHLLLGNLYAKQLNQPKLARQHYLKVLADMPHHPKAAEIRYWLAANP